MADHGLEDEVKFGSQVELQEEFDPDYEPTTESASSRLATAVAGPACHHFRHCCCAHEDRSFALHNPGSSLAALPVLYALPAHARMRTRTHAHSPTYSLTHPLTC